MATKWLKGIVVEISGDTSGLKKALGSVDADTRALQKELNQVNKLLKLDPKNTELLAQKTQILRQEIANTSDKYKALAKAKEEMDKKGSLTDEEAKRYRELTRELIATGQELKRLKNESEGIGESFKKAENDAISFGDIVKANIVSEAIIGGFNALVSAISSVSNAMLDVVKSGIEYNAQMEQYQTSFTAMLGDTEKANAMIENIKRNASTSPFDVQSLVEANQSLLTTGENAEKTEKVIQALGDAVAYTGGGNAELKRMASNLAQIKNVGKASSVDIKQFANAGINIYGILADSMGKSVSQVKDMSISYEQLTKALEDASNEGGLYFGAMARQTETYTGQLNLLKSNWNEFTGTLASDTTGAITNTFLPALNNMVVAMNEGFKTDGITGMVDAMFDGIGEMARALIDPANIDGFFNGAKELITGVLDGITSYGINGENADLTREAVAHFTSGMLDLLGTAVSEFTKAGLGLAGAVVQGFVDGLIDSFVGTDLFANYSSWLQSWADKLHGRQKRSYHFSAGYGNFDGFMASGGFGGVTLNASFNINNGNNIDVAMVQSWADIMTDRINDNLGRAF